MAGIPTRFLSATYLKQTKEEIEEAAHDIELVLVLPKGKWVAVLDIKDYRNVASIAIEVKRKIGVRFEEIQLFVGEQKLENTMCINEYP